MMENPEHEGSAAKTWLVVFLLLLIVGFQGGLSYYMIGDRGQPDWDYRPVPDVPGESPYAIYKPQPFPQHVKGAEVDYPPLDGEWGLPYAVYGTPPPDKGVQTAGPPMEPQWDETMFPPPQQNAIGNR